MQTAGYDGTRTVCILCTLGYGWTQAIIQTIIPAEVNVVYDNRQGRLGLDSKVQVLKSRLDV